MAKGKGPKQGSLVAAEMTPTCCCAPCFVPQATGEGTRAVPFSAARSLSNWGNTPSLCQIGSVWAVPGWESLLSHLGLK